MARTPATQTPADPSPPYPRDALFRPDGPINPRSVDDAIRTLMRCLPHDPDEETAYRNQRMYVAICTISAMYPRDEVEMMYAIGAIASCQAAMACFRLGMNGALPNGENTRHIAAAGSAIRTFDAMIKGLERRQARPCMMTPGPNDWRGVSPDGFMDWWTGRVRSCNGSLETADQPPPTGPRPASPPRPQEKTPPPPAAERMSQQGRSDTAPEPVWTAEMLARTKTALEAEAQGPPPVEGVAPDGSIVVPENPTPEQEAYIGARLVRNVRKHWPDATPGGKLKIPRLRPGDRIP